MAKESTNKRQLHVLLGMTAITVAACGVDQPPSPLRPTPEPSAATATAPEHFRPDSAAQRFVATPHPVDFNAITAVEQAKLLAADGKDNLHVGWSLAFSADTVVAGTPHDTFNGDASGSAYVFVRNGNVWTQQQKLLPSDPAAFDYFAEAVSVSGDTLIASASQDDDQGATSGSAYVFVRSGGVWTQQQKLLPSGGMSSDEFGVSVAIDGDTAMVGTTANDNGPESGSAFVFTRSGVVWTEQQKLLPSDGMANARFGGSIKISGDTAIIGAGLSSNTGAAYVFVRSGGVWMQQAKLLASDGASGDSFGTPVALSGDTAVISAPEDDDKGGSSGSVYVFERSGGVWTQQQKLLASDGANFDHFGQSIGVSGDTLIVGASYAGPYGRAYLFSRTGGVWTEQQKLKGSDSALTDFFGSSAGLWGNTAVVGASGHDNNGTDSGAVYVFTLYPTGDPCVMSSECMTGFCVDGVCCNTTCGGGATNDCQACSVTAGALTDGICAPLPASVVCRPAAGECDKPESCNGVSQTCPANMNLPNGTVCTGGTCIGGVCVSGGSSSSSASSGSTTSSGSGGAAGGAGSGGSGGSAGNTGSGGSGGFAGNTGSGGSGGSAGNTGSGGSGGSAGNAASSGSGGSAGNAASSGSGGSASSTTSSGGSSGSGGSAGHGDQSSDDGGCGCRTAGHPSSRTWAVDLSIVGLMLASTRRRRNRRRNDHNDDERTQQVR